MPFDNPEAAAAPTRRSSRHRTAAFEVPAASTPALSSDDLKSSTPTPVSRRAARLRSSSERTASAPAPVVESDSPIVVGAAAPESPFSEKAADAFVQASLTFRSIAPERKADAAASADVPVEELVAEGVPADGVVAGDVARRRSRIRKVVTLGATVGVMSLAGLLAVSMTLPAEALAAVGPRSTAGMSLVAASAASEEDEGHIQAFVTSSDVQNETLARAEDFSTVSLVDLASEQGIKFSDSVFTNDPDAAIQWPFLVGVSMSSGYGPRWGRMHEGIDFTPGEGAPIQAIADGTVRIATEQGGDYGVTVYIDHVIDGQVITSHYSHMQYGSLQVKAGDTVKVGDIVGHTGNTGHSFGAHLHFEIIVSGSTIDPLPWLRSNAGRYSLD